MPGQIVFSFYVFGSNADGLAYFDNIRVTGVTTAVPQPSSAVLVAWGGAAFIGYVARRRTERRLQPQSRP